MLRVVQWTVEEIEARRMIDWTKSVVEMVLIRQVLQDLDTRHLWQYHLPKVAATEEELLAVEARLGEPLDPEYRSFLRCAGGWPGFYQSVDLFGPSDFMDGPRFHQALALLSLIEDTVLVEVGLTREDLLPIAATPIDLDLFVMARRSTSCPGTVIWLAGREIDRFPNFREYFLAMMDYNRQEGQELREAASV